MTTIYARFKGILIVEEDDKAYLQILDSGGVCTRYELTTYQLVLLATKCNRAAASRMQGGQ